jgi:hypothetical protein
MNSRFVVLSALFVAVLFSLLPAAAQEETVSLQFLSFPKSIDPAPVELVIGKGQTIEVEIPSNELSPTYKVKRQRSWTFGETVTGDDGEVAFKVYGKTPALSSNKQLIILVRKGAEYSDGFDVIAVDGISSRFGGGKFLFLNAATTDIAGEVGGQKFALKPGKHAIVKPKSTVEGRNLAQATFYIRKKDKPKPFFTSKWPLSDNTRALIFFYLDPDSKRIQLHSIRDYL